MRNGAAESGVISKEIERIFQRVGEIIDEDQKKHRAENTAMGNSSLNKKGEMREFHSGPHVDYDQRGSPQAKRGDFHGYHKRRVW